MEAKAEARNSGKEVCMLDFVRLDVFGKNAVDFYKLQGTLLVQAIGPCLTFYLLQKKKSGNVYVMVELDEFTFPMPISQIPGIFGYLKRLAKIVGIFKKYIRTRIMRKRKYSKYNAFSLHTLTGS